ncbi:Putative transcriptional regulatory protein [Mycobacterium tuberculosis]|uniref:Putative transcriptional regulatory protein n=1 Tax=Mycobacterium tuberculosis TaxID=1773 RepID=A0A0U0RKL1_MYCTX|nr:Putative transcriptional regulatory protein [Mycobacterium tuberculosis]
MFTANCEILAGKTALPSMEIVSQLLHEPEEIDPATLTPMTARIGPALIHQHVLFTGSPPDREQLTRIIDAMILTTGERRES